MPALCAMHCRRRLHLIAYITFSLFLLQGPVALAEPLDIASIRRKVSTSSSGTELQAAFRAAFSNGAAVEFVSACRIDDNDTLSCRGAWEAVKDSIPAKKRHRPDELRSPSVLAIERFLGFFEGRIRIQVPSWWEDSLRTVRTNDDLRWSTRIGNAGILNSIPVPSGLTKAADPRMLQITHYFNVEKSGDDVVLRSMIQLPRPASGSLRPADSAERIDNGCTVPAELVKRFELISPSLICYMDDALCIVAVVDMLAAPFELYCIDRRSSRVMWKSNVWTGPGATPMVSGQGYQHAVSIQLNGDRIFVYGCDAFGLYVEGFARADGHNLLRFSTSF